MYSSYAPAMFASREPLDPAAAARSIPRPSRLAAKVEVKPARAAKAAAALGLETAGDLLEHLPHRHEDTRDAKPIAGLAKGEEATVIGDVRRIASRRTRRRGLSMVEATVADDTGLVKAIWFNQPWLVDKLPAGTRVVLSGRYDGSNRFTVRRYEVAPGATADDVRAAGMTPVYPATEGLSAARIRELVKGVSPLIRHTLEPLPGRLRAQEGLAERAAALAAVHFPEDEEETEQARRRLVFEELLMSELAFGARRRARRERETAPVLRAGGELVDPWLAALPFEPTRDQRAAFAAIDEDLAAGRPMQRLLMGEVGSGKTVVALHAMLRAAESGGQAALMAPTETLAEQHLATLDRLLGGHVPIALLTGSTPAARRREILGRLATGELSLVVGTHALIESGVEFRELVLAVVDEQHRFGVRQRAALAAPHALHMTATPIPRTLALTQFGELDVTALRELPAGRQPIETFAVNTSRLQARAYERAREEIERGRQVFVVCPLVEESEALQAKAATTEAERLQVTEFKDHRVALIHGQMSSRKKAEEMAAFAGGDADVLVATSVIEVGIDVPNATVMIVEAAERYGLSQLHQLRGRIGRGADPGVCILLGDPGNPRLAALVGSSDGFELAEVDLEIRGMGEFLGTRQHGLSEFPVELLQRARDVADRILARDPQLESPENALLREAVAARFGADLEPIPA
jgi:ATP-dependent DNA helicase RecG